MVPSDCKGVYGMLPSCVPRKRKHSSQFLCQQSVAAFSRPVGRDVSVRIRCTLDRLNKGMLLWSCHPGLVIGEQVHNRPFPLAQLFTWSGQTSLVLFCLALNLIGPRAVDVLSELSYAPITPDHFPSLFCKVGTSKVLVLEWAGNIFLRDGNCMFLLSQQNVLTY